MLYQTYNPHGGDIYGSNIILDFSANTNPYGTPSGVINALCKSLNSLHHYPDPYCRALIQAISHFEQIPPAHILCGNGAAELIYSYCTAAKPKTALELCPTFSEYSLALSQVSCAVDHYPLTKETGFLLDDSFLGYLKRTAPDVLFLCNPNNPTGRIIAPSLLLKILNVCRDQSIRLFVDECFLDLSDEGQSLTPYVSSYPNLFILKAFTKSYGMAGVRLGYCLCSDSLLMQKMSTVVQPWNVSSLAQTAGIAALKETEFLQKSRVLIHSERTWLQSQLESLGFWVCPSTTNYLFFHGPCELHTALKEKQIAIRNCDNYVGLEPGWYRTAVRLHNENTQLIEALKAIQKEL